VAYQDEVVRETVDWRREVRKHPVAWSLGALGAGFIAGYGIAAAVKGDRGEYNHEFEYVPSAPHAYDAHPVIGETAPATHETPIEVSAAEEEGMGMLDRFKETRVYDRLRQEAAAVGNSFVDELSKTARQVVLPAVIRKIRDWIEGVVPKTSGSRP